jgi:hypothetical protein
VEFCLVFVIQLSYALPENLIGDRIVVFVASKCLIDPC